MDVLVLVGGSLAAVALLAGWLRGRQRDADAVDQAEYRPPPVHGGAGPH